MSDKHKSFFRSFKRTAEANHKVTRLTDNKNKITIEKSESSIKFSFTTTEFYPFDQEIDQDVPNQEIDQGIPNETVVDNDKLISLPRLPEQED